MISRAHRRISWGSIHGIFVFLTIMGDKRIENLVQEVFKKAKLETVSKTRFALARHIAEKTNLSSKTLERAYDRYVKKTNPNYKLQEDTIDLLCNYLGFENFTDYAKQAIIPPGTSGTREPNPSAIKSAKPFWKVLAGILAIAVILFVWSVKRGNTPGQENCMTWADSLYIPISCDTGPLSNYGTPIVPLDPVKLKSFKKVKVTMATRFFSEQTNQPLIWYFKDRNGEMEYYTAPGLHPVNGRTLKAITEHMINEHVQLHIYREESFLKE